MGWSESFAAKHRRLDRLRAQHARTCAGEVLAARLGYLESLMLDDLRGEIAATVLGSF
jgi:hypothetical protein